ncbi:MAG TPA: Gfo/Idh/MocA family oxidoreductase [Pirellulales bacterium]|jgi:predicted dehydrogenase|nr:Gfo/Idh/MocA family oxidoreductase [Pirellulales bacterium]
MGTINRRRFLEDSMLATAAAAAMAASAGPSELLADDVKSSKSPNERLICAVIGCNGRGGEHIKEWSKREDVEIGTICDIDTKVGYNRCEEIGKNHRKPKYVQDLRKLFEDKSVDFVSIATPNHWHSLAAIWAMQAGKDVYVEKPVSHNVSEGRRDVQTAARHQRICQAGTQSRSSPGLHKAIAYLRDGKLGEVKLARALCYKRRGTIGPKGNYPIPPEVDYDLWSGPAPIKPLTRPKFHYDWHWQWDYGNGDIGNQGIHQMDIARWGLGEKSLSSSILTYGGRFGYEDAGETANTQVAIQEFADGKTLVFEVRGLETAPMLKWTTENGKEERAMTAVFFYGTEGTMVCPSYSDASIFDPSGKLVMSFKGGGDHFGNFLKGVRSRKMEDLNAPILEGHISSALCHLGNVDYRLGDLHSPGEALERLKSIKTNENVQETLDRVIAHLSDNKVKFDDRTKLQIGASLAFDPQSETFVNNSLVNNAQANAFLTREYRAPFVVPTADNA